MLLRETSPPYSEWKCKPEGSRHQAHCVPEIVTAVITSNPTLWHVDALLGIGSVIPTDMTATIALQQRNSIFYVVRAEM
jgi:hypothetical protein